MFQQAWANNVLRLSPPPKPWEDVFGNIGAVALHMWEEHCVECAPPDCYLSCKLYEARADLKCSRFVHGIVPTDVVTGLEGPCFEIQFRRWAKLETKLPHHPAMFSKAEMMQLSETLNRTERMARGVANVLSPLDRYRKIQGAQYAWHQKVFPRWAGTDSVSKFDGLYMEFYAEEEASFTLELLGPEGVVLRHAIEIVPGWNRDFIDREQWPLISGDGLLRLSNNLETESTLLISAMHLVCWNDRSHAAQYFAREIEHTKEPLPKVKCVIFDLDNTLWDGVIGDDGPEGVAVRQETVDFIFALDQRGIICAVASKNEVGIALDKIESLGLSEHLLFPEINWGPKSQSIQRIAEAMNVSLNTLAFVDDNVFERNEVSATLPQLRVYDENSLLDLLNLPDFDVPVTAQAAKRRLSYLAESKRAKKRTGHFADVDVFLRSCNMQLSILDPRQNVDRCLEMIDRTNQFNISGRRYSKLEFERLLQDDFHWCWTVKDDYGDYGIVGYLRAVRDSDAWVVKDFVMSCRVAQKRIEECLFTHLREKLNDGLPLMLDLVKTNRNDAIIGKLAEMGSVSTIEENRFRVTMDVELMGADVVAISPSTDV